jgi:hypothetical protein
METFTNIQQLYQDLLQMPDLHSFPQLTDGLLIWKLYKDAYIQVSCDGNGADMDIVPDSVFHSPLLHWHGSMEAIRDQLHTLGKKGHIAVIKKSLYGTELFYAGPPDRYSSPNPWGISLGRILWHARSLIYLEQSP